MAVKKIVRLEAGDKSEEGAGRNFGIGGDNFNRMNVWLVTQKAKLRRAVAALAIGMARNMYGASKVIEQTIAIQ